MRAAALLVFILPGVAAAPLLHAVVPDLPGPGPGDEGFAILSDEPWDLSGWFVTDEEGAWLAPEGTWLAPGVPLWLTGNQSTWASYGGSSATQWPDARLRLANDGETLFLMDADGVVADAFTWGPGGDVTPRSPGLVYLREGGSWVTPRLHRIGETTLEQPTFQVSRLTLYATPDSSFEVP